MKPRTMALRATAKSSRALCRALRPFFMKPDYRYSINWVFKYFFPGLWISLLIPDIIHRVIFRQYLGISTLFDLVSLLGEIFISYYMIYYLTVEYELNESALIVHSFLVRQRWLYFKDIAIVKDYGGFSLSDEKSVGFNALIVELKKGNKVPIIGLREHFQFLQEIERLRSK